MLAVNRAFYRAFNDRDYDAMANIWAPAGAMVRRIYLALTGSPASGGNGSMPPLAGPCEAGSVQRLVQPGKGAQKERL